VPRCSASTTIDAHEYALCWMRVPRVTDRFHRTSRGWMRDRSETHMEATSITRREALLKAGRVLGTAAFATTPLGPSAAAYVGEFWDTKQPGDWTEDELKRLTSRSPWAKEASIDSKAAVGPLSTRTPATRRSPGNPNGLSQIPEFSGKWDATIR